MYIVPWLLEAGYPELEAIIMKRRVNFITKFMRNKSGDEPLSYVLELCQNAKAFKVLRDAIEYTGYPVIQSLVRLKNQCNERGQTSSRMSTYVAMNPGLTVHKLYTIKNRYVPDLLRRSFTCLRLSAHRLHVETGRWSRIPRDQRVCDKCHLNEIQAEYHVVFKCTHTHSGDIRQLYPTIDTWEQFFDLDNVYCIFMMFM